MQISLNGKSHNVENITTLDDLIDHFCKNNKYVIAELNGSVIKSPLWRQTPVKEGDQIELVRMVAGG